MWQELAKIVAHAALHSAMKRRQADALAEKNREAHAAIPEPANDPRPPAAPKKPIGLVAFAVVLALLGSCCLFTGIVSLASNTQRALGAHTATARDEALGGIGYGFAFCIFPSAAMLGGAGWLAKRARAARGARAAVAGAAVVVAGAEPGGSPPPPDATSTALHGRPWSGTCPFCRTAVAVVLVPGIRAKCPSCRAGLGVTG